MRTRTQPQALVSITSHYIKQRQKEVRQRERERVEKKVKIKPLLKHISMEQNSDDIRKGYVQK